MNESLENMPHYLERIAFYDAVKKKICDCNANSNYVLVSLDLDNFNYINDLFSYDIGNSVLNNMTFYFSDKLREDELFSRIHADHFKFLLHQKSNEETLARFHEISDMKSVVVNILPLDYSLVISAGIVKLTNSEENLASYLDKANYARKLAKETQVNQCYFYDEEMKNNFEWKKIVTLMMEHA
ncbi:MAG: diguanylate cyclase, partial [Longicatena sp.]